MFWLMVLLTVKRDVSYCTLEYGISRPYFNILSVEEFHS